MSAGPYHAGMPAAAPASQRPVRLGIVSFLNTLPLVDGLERCADLELRRSVPSLLLGQLLRGEVDAALCSSIDYQRSGEPLAALPCGLLGCTGRTLTVRLYSAVPIERVACVHCDTDSHTSVVLMQVLLREMHGLRPELVDFDAREHVAGNRPLDWPETMLLIGDKVVTDSPPAVRYPHQLDLGEAWAARTGLPFVFALWMARRSADPAALAAVSAVLDRQRRHNRERLDLVVRRKAPGRGWPTDLAGTYLKEMLDFEVTADRVRGLDLFFDKAFDLGLIERRRLLEFASA
jgi:chorismate dehydratase